MTGEEAAQAMIDPPVELFGPIAGRTTYKLVVNGCVVPYIQLYRAPERAPQDWSVVIDDRWEIDATEEEIRRWGYGLAQAMAVAAGYNYCGPESRPVSPFARQLGMLAPDPIEEGM